MSIGRLLPEPPADSLLTGVPSGCALRYSPLGRPGGLTRLPARPTQLSWPVRRPPHPGDFLRSRYLAPLGISQTDLAATLGISRRRVNELINGRRAITPDTAVRMAAYFGNEAAFWMQLQVAWDMHGAVQQALVRRAGTRTTAPRRPSSPA